MLIVTIIRIGEVIRMTRKRDRIKRRTKTEIQRMLELAKKTWLHIRSPYDDDKKDEEQDSENHE